MDVETDIPRIANVAIQVAVEQDVAAKMLLLSACLQQNATAADVVSVSRTSKVIATELAQLGVAI